MSRLWICPDRGCDNAWCIDGSMRKLRAQMQVIYRAQGESKAKTNKRGEIRDKGYSGEMARRERLRVH
jgi:hypothetical protein